MFRPIQTSLHFSNRTNRTTLISASRLGRYSYVPRVLDKDSKSPHPTPLIQGS